MSETLTLEEVAQENDLVLLDANVLPTLQDIGYYFDSTKPDELYALRLTYQNMFRTIIDNKNIHITGMVRNETKRLLRQSKRESRTHKKGTNIVETFARHAKFPAEEVKKHHDVAKTLKGISDDIKHIINRTKSRDINLNLNIYNSMLSLVNTITKNIRYYTNYKDYMPENQKSITDETVLATALAYSVERKGRTAILTNDGRFVHLLKGVNDMVFASELYPLNDKITLALEDFPPTLYREQKYSSGRFMEQIATIRDAELPDALYEAAERELSFVRDLIPNRPSVGEISA